MSHAAKLIGELWPDHELSVAELQLIADNVRSCDQQAVELGIRAYRANCPRMFAKTPRDLAALKAACWDCHRRLRSEPAGSTERRSDQQEARDYLLGVRVDSGASGGLSGGAMRIVGEYRKQTRDRIVQMATETPSELEALRGSILGSPDLSGTLRNGCGAARGLAETPVYDAETGRVSSLWLAVIVSRWSRGGELWD